jgi:hypothetical protein
MHLYIVDCKIFNPYGEAIMNAMGQVLSVGQFNVIS